jgi:hypothetical protein
MDIYIDVELAIFPDLTGFLCVDIHLNNFLELSGYLRKYLIGYLDEDLTRHLSEDLAGYYLKLQDCRFPLRNWIGSKHWTVSLQCQGGLCVHFSFCSP